MSLSGELQLRSKHLPTWAQRYCYVTADADGRPMLCWSKSAAGAAAAAAGANAAVAPGTEQCLLTNRRGPRFDGAATARPAARDGCGPSPRSELLVTDAAAFEFSLRALSVGARAEERPSSPSVTAVRKASELLSHFGDMSPRRSLSAEHNKALQTPAVRDAGRLLPAATRGEEMKERVFQLRAAGEAEFAQWVKGIKLLQREVRLVGADNRPSGVSPRITPPPPHGQVLAQRL